MLAQHCNIKHAGTLPRSAAAWQCRPTRPSRRHLQACQSSASASGTGALSTAHGSRVKSLFDGVDRRSGMGGQAGGAGGRTTWDAFQAADDAWTRSRNMKVGPAAGPAPQFVRTSSQPTSSSTTNYDVVVAGGTLGIFMAAALAQKGWRVAVLERGPLRGREQDWNISRKELNELVEIGLMTSEEAESCISIEFNPVRVGFNGGRDIWTRDVLNLGVSPAKLVQLMRAKLEAAGGKVFENVALQNIDVHPDAALLTVRGMPQASSSDGSNASSSSVSSSSSNQGTPGASSSGRGEQRVAYESVISAGLVLDCMGNASPVVRQMRWGKHPDGVCLVVGGCASGFPEAANAGADVIYTNSDLQPPGTGPTAGLQMFWEAFPASTGPTHRTTYMFAYMDATPSRPSLSALMDTYLDLMPQYQGLKSVDDVEFNRVLFGCFPTFRDSPLRPGFDRVLQIGDASGIQSPLSFGGFGALTRHMRRLSNALHEALSSQSLTASELAMVQSYNPGLSSAWMLQKAMSGGASGNPPPGLINKILRDNFAAMERLGEPVMKPFLQDVIQLGPLLKTMAAQVAQEPGFVPKLLQHVGIGPVADWTGHVSALAAYSALNATAAHPLRAWAASMPTNSKQRYALGRLLDAWEYGSGADYKL